MKKYLRKFFSLILSVWMALSCACVGFVMSDATEKTLVGDVNADGDINAIDAVMILKISVGLIEITDEKRKDFDFNADGQINSVEALMILRKSIKAPIAVESITLNKSSQSVLVGTKLTLEVVSYLPTIADLGEVHWKTSDASVASVNGGIVEAKKAGKAVITASCGQTHAEFHLTVGAKASSLTLNLTQFSMRQGSARGLKATVAPSNAYNKKVKWISSDTKVATVDANGLVKGVMMGTATITCTTTDGTNLKATCKVTVNAMPIPYVSQLPKYPTGCEAASACMLLQYYGFSVTLDEMIAAIPRKNLYKKNGKTYGPDINEMFVGDPRHTYTSSTPGYGAFSPVITKAMQKVIDKKGGGYQAVKISGCTFPELLQYISNGQPAVVWATYKMKKPTQVNSWYIESTGKYFEYPRGTHVMVLSGYSKDKVVTVDPYDNGVLSFSRSTFRDRWELLGNQAIILKKVKK